jgi:hypothetical protein
VSTHTTRTLLIILAIALLGLVLTGCAGTVTENTTRTPTVSTTSVPATTEANMRFPDVLAVEITAASDGTYTLNVTMSSPYDTPERYADGWRALTPDGTVLGEKALTHDHASEQPFTRTQTGVEIPAGVTTIVVEGRDTANGYGGKTVEVQVP